uniref:endonuclease VII domain-containing protein n=1 Tax=Nitrospira cf. moscoviensis SBR1015 TaxID=96242 RepID=UPI00111D166A
HRKYRAANREKARERHQKYKYGLTTEQYNAMLLEQGGGCAICRGQCKRNSRLSVDHCHRTGAVRGLLCSNCNTGIGMFKDSPALLQAAADYLKKFAQNIPHMEVTDATVLEQHQGSG